MILKDFHIHTTFCDGKNTPEEMVLKAIELNMSEIGFSAHSHTFFDESYCMQKENIQKYKDEILSLKEKYKDKIKIYCGIEMDFFSDMDTSDFDYTIGSVHYLKVNGRYYPVDSGEEKFITATNECYNGDFYSYAEDYFDTVSKVAEKIKPDIIGHFDLITKYNEENKFFDEKNERYVSAYKKAIDKLVKYNIPFEINMGGMSKGFKQSPYPSIDILKYIFEKGGKVVLSSDAHTKDTLLYKFDEYEKIAEEIGFEF